MNLNVQDATRTTLEKSTVAFTQRVEENFSQNTYEIYNDTITGKEFNYIKK